MSLRNKSLRGMNSSVNLDSTAALLASPTVFKRYASDNFSMDTTVASLDSTTFLPGELSKYYNQSILAEAAEPLDALAQAFFDVFNTYKDVGSPFDTIKQFHQVCQNMGEGAKGNDQLCRWLEEEKNTWRLVEALYRDRLNFNEDEDAPMELALSEKEAMLEVFRRDSVTRQCQLVVDWLEQAEAEKMEKSHHLRAEHFSEKTVCWENTVYQLNNGHKMSTQSGYTLNLVTELDPDAPVRQQRKIHKLDADDDALLLGQILSHIRCGQLEQAQQLCVHCGQPWRAATLEGWKLYHNPNLNKEGDLSVLLPTEGNPNRDLWKLAAWRMAEDQRMSQMARTTYAALCGHLQAMLPSMMTWSDWLWSHLKSMIDVRIEEEVRNRVDRDYLDMPAPYWSNKMSLIQIFSTLAACPNPKVRAEHAEEFPTVQRSLVLDDMVTLYATLAAWARQHKDLTAPKSPLLLRFAAHLVLVLRQLNKEETESCAQHAAEVLRIYSQYVMSLKNPELIISYVAQLAKRDQVDTLALFLQDITDPDLKSHCLVLANNYGLDVEKTARQVVVAIREKPTSMLGNAVEDEDAKIQALDWLVICPSQSGEALWHANALVRQFVLKGKLELAANAYSKIPEESLQALGQQITLHDDDDPNIPARYRAAMKEYISFTCYLDAQKDFSEWVHYLHKKKPVPPEPLPKEANFQQKLLFEEKQKYYKVSFENWQKNLTHMAMTCKKRFVNILTFPDGGWLQDSIELEPSPEVIARNAEIDSLIKKVVPNSAFLVHDICLKSGLPEDSLDLANILVSEKHRLYHHFSKKDLREMLLKISEASVELLQKKYDSFGHEATS